jgi:hypothetical protein
MIRKGVPVNAHECRACRAEAGSVVLDLGNQPACDYFPPCGDPGPDPVYPLQMWLCSRCGLAQLLDDPTMPEEPKGAEPAALVAQAADAVARVAAAGLLPAGARVAEYGSPHGGSWLGLLADRGLRAVEGESQAEVILDCFGMMHAADQSGALAERASRLAQGGVLLLQYHSLDTIIAQGQWNALRHGHYAYYSTTALRAMLAAVGFSPLTAWHFDLYGGTVLLAAVRDVDGPRQPDATVGAVLAAEGRTGVCDPDVLSGLQYDVMAKAVALHDWLAASAAAGRAVLGYGAASRAVALLRTAGVDGDLLRAVADASPAKRGLRMPGTTIPVISPAELTALRPDEVALFVSDLMAEVRASHPEIEAHGGRWVDADALGSRLGGFEEDTQPGKAAASGRTDAAHREPEFVGDLRVRCRRVRHQHLHEALPAPGELGHGLAHPGRPFLGEQRLVDFRLMPGGAVERVLLVSEHQPLAGRQGPQALVPCRCREPGTDPVGMLDPVDVLDQPHPGRLEYVRGIALNKLEVPGDRPDEPAIPIDEALPRVGVAVGGPVQQRGHIEIRDPGTVHHRALVGQAPESLLCYYRASRHRPP